MSRNLNDIEKLVYFISTLPGLGSRSARRIVLYLLQDKDNRLQTLEHLIHNIYSSIHCCSECFNFSSDKICEICSDPSRDNQVIAVVETVAELWAIERSKTFKGKYHVLNAQENHRNHSSFNLDKLLSRCKRHQCQELIIATNPTIEGQMIAHSVIDYFHGVPILISKLAYGLPIGGELDYIDEGTLTLAINSRRLYE
ncbi:Recombination protein RecR [Rickettsiales endosymbiont of Paramecium tredecaurelia]|uniref:recombination mediator RecR n=1 Tax=Candidatus Sarmatiella mevalonica TaxID=2770581 RepID=UPI0019209AFB|nr:recombination mediator RecR [Candidatus Sarmatiella mevalonica]MBL3284308.1 Recombination protein RecR [Candidatus Sarmatiella mevalonica]